MTEPADGLLGLGFTEASDFGVESFFSSLIGTGTLDEEVFSIYLNGDSGELVLGGTNPARYIPNSIIWFNVIANVSDYLHPLDPRQMYSQHGLAFHSELLGNRIVFPNVEQKPHSWGTRWHKCLG